MKALIGIIIYLLCIVMAASGVTCLLVATFCDYIDAYSYRTLCIIGYMFAGIGIGSISALIATALFLDEWRKS